MNPSQTSGLGVLMKPLPRIPETSSSQQIHACRRGVDTPMDSPTEEKNLGLGAELVDPPSSVSRLWVAFLLKTGGGG